MFKDTLKKLRKKKGITQDELSEKLFVSRTLVTKWEKGIRFPADDILPKIAEFFGVSTDYLIEGDKNQLDTLNELSECISDADASEGEITDDNAIMELAAKITEFLKMISKDDREIFLMRYYQYKSVEKIAKIKKLGENDVRTRLAEIRTRLLNYFEKDGNGDEE